MNVDDMFDLKRFRKENGIKQSDVATWLHCGQSNVSMLEKNMNLSDSQIDAIRKNSGIDISIYITEDALSNKYGSLDDFSRSERNTRPRIPYDVAAGTLTDTVEGVSNYQCEQIPVISAFPRYDFTIRVIGKSMEPEYYSGDEVACLRINERRFLQWGRVHVLDTTQGVIIKRIYDGGDAIICRSYNPEFPDFSIPKEDIRSYNLVVGSLRL